MAENWFQRMFNRGNREQAQPQTISKPSIQEQPATENAENQTSSNTQINPEVASSILNANIRRNPKWVADEIRKQFLLEQNKTSPESQTEQAKIKEKILQMVEELVESGWNSSLLVPGGKGESLADFLKQELGVEVKLDTDEIADFPEVDKMITYNAREILIKQAKRLGLKTGIGMGVGLLVGGVTGFFTGGASWGLIWAGIAGSAGGRVLIEGIKAGANIWGKGKDLRIELAKNYLMNSIDAQKIAKEVLENSEDPQKFWQAAEKIVNLIYSQSPKNSNETLKDTNKSREELQSWEKKWNTGAEIASFAGGIGVATAYGLTRGTEKLVEQKMQAAAHRGLRIELDGKQISHFVEKIGNTWRYVIEQFDIDKAQNLLTNHWQHWLHQVGGKVAEVGTLHASTLSEGSIREFITQQAQKEITRQLLTQVASGALVGSAVAWGVEEKRIMSEYNLDSDDLASREIGKKALTEAIKKEQEKLKIIEAEITREKIRDYIKEAQVNDVFVGRYILADPEHYDMVRMQVNKIDRETGDVKLEVIDKRSDGSEYEKKNQDVNLNDDKTREKFNQFLIPWNLHKEYTYSEWQEIEKILTAKKDIIDSLKTGQELKFASKFDVSQVIVDWNKDTKYFLKENPNQNNKDSNKIKIYYKDNTNNNVEQEVELHKLVGLLKPEVVTTPVSGTTPEQVVAKSDKFKKLNEEFAAGKKKIVFREELPADFCTKYGLDPSKIDGGYEIDKIDKEENEVILIDSKNGEEKKIPLDELLKRYLNLEKEGEQTPQTKIDKEKADLAKKIKDKIIARRTADEITNFPPSYEFKIAQIITIDGDDYIITETTDENVTLIKAIKDVNGDFEKDNKGNYKFDQNYVINLGKFKLAEEFDGYKGVAQIRKIRS